MPRMPRRRYEPRFRTPIQKPLPLDTCGVQVFELRHDVRVETVARMSHLDDHAHTLIAEATQVVLPGVSQWQLGCYSCGPQWVVTVDWERQSIRIAWIDLPYIVQMSRGGMTAVKRR